jgi:hypothetical protein
MPLFSVECARGRIGFLETITVPAYECNLGIYSPYIVIMHIKTKIYFVVHKGKPLKSVVKLE